MRLQSGFRAGLLLCLLFCLAGCTKREMDFSHPDVDLFVKQLKEGTYRTTNERGVIEVPRFARSQIPELLDHAGDLTRVPFFPTVYNTKHGRLRLGECMLWIIERIRQGKDPSQGFRLVREEAESYEPAYFLTDDELLDAVGYYRRWWDNRVLPRTLWITDPCYDNPLCGSGYRWW